MRLAHSPVLRLQMHYCRCLKARACSAGGPLCFVPRKRERPLALLCVTRLYCDMIKDSPTDYEQLLGVTRVGELTFEDCKDQLVQLNLISEILKSVPYDPSRSRGWRYEPGVTYRIKGDVYNDPFGLDYKNGPNDIFGDGR